MANMGYDDSARGHSPPAGGMSERVHSPWTGDIDYDAGPVSLKINKYKKIYSYMFTILIIISFQLGGGTNGR